MIKDSQVISLLLKQGLADKNQIELAQEEMKRAGLTLDQSLERLGFATEEDIANIRAAVLGIPYIDLTNYLIDKELIKLVPEAMAKKYSLVPLFKVGNTLTIGMVDPENILAQDYVRDITQIDIIEPVLISRSGLAHVLDTYYGTADSIDELVGTIDKEKIVRTGEKGMLEAAEETPIVKLVNLMIMQAVQSRASDIHVEPDEKILRIRYRVDGLLQEVNKIPSPLQNAVISRIKVLSNMDIAESRKPQDGRIRMNIENRELDIRVSTFPTVYGENVVMRLLDRSAVLPGLRELGFAKDELEEFNKLIRRTYGIILVTGPTGSGKTTTLYAAISTINSVEKNVITIEDPVEYMIAMVRQTQVNPKAGITFANGLRNILRQDPDIVMVGEIRDRETVEIAIQASLTGHLVFSTLHTNDAPSALTRLIDMGIEPFLISSSVIGILAQRLVRLTCDKCKEKYRPSEVTLKNTGLDQGLEFYRGKGCKKCNNSGFMGRSAIFELLPINEEIREMIDAKRSAAEIKKKAIELGIRTLRQNGLEKVRAGITTLEEILRVTEIE